MALEQELQAFKAGLPTWKAEHEGQFALIKGSELVDFFTSYDDALKVGYSRFGLEPFLVKQVHAFEHAQFASRLIEPCPI